MLLIYASFSHFNVLLATKIKAFVKSPDLCNCACTVMVCGHLLTKKSLAMSGGEWWVADQI